MLFSRKKFFYFILFLVFFVLGHKTLAFFPSSKNNFDFSAKKIIYLNDNGLNYAFKTSANSVSELLNEKNIKLAEHDELIPAEDGVIFSGTSIEIRRAVKIKIEADGKTNESYTAQKNLLAAVLESGIKLNPRDLIDPSKDSLPQNNLKVIITRINVEEKKVEEAIDFKTITKSDDKLGWREEKIEQSGEKGIREVVYKITYKNGKEVTRIALSKSVTKEPVSKIITKGTYVKLGKTHTGLGTWYAFKGGLFAASPWLPMGSYARVTNKANGKSVIVQINDRGPFGKNRIIDLDKVAFAKIASLGAGVIDTKVEEILN